MAPTEDEIRDLFAMANNPAIAAERVARADGFDPSRSWVDGSPKRLSDRLWSARQWDRDQIDALLVNAIRTGEDGLVTARKLEQFLDPAFAPTRRDGRRIVRGQNRAIVTDAPGRGGSGSFPARRLARTEITRAHGAGTIAAAEKSPFVQGVRWMLSGRHPKADPCNGNAERDSGLGAGVYPPKDVPTYPNHPQCLCSLAPVANPDADAVVDALRQQFGLGEVEAAPAAAPTAPAPSVGAAQTTAEAKAAAKAMGLDIAGVRKGDLDIANGIMRSVERMRARGWDPPTTWIVDHGDVFDRGDLTLAHFDPSRRSRPVVINAQHPFWRDPAAGLRDMKAKGWLSSDDPLHIFDHESGHAIHFRENPSRFFEGTGDFHPSTATADRATAVGEVSRYAGTEATEFVAEVFAGRMAGIRFSQEVMDLYEIYGGPLL